VRLVESGERLRAVFSAKVKDTVRVRGGQLVAVDRGPAPPEIAWRWYRGVVEELRPEGAAVRRLDLEPGNVRLVSDPDGIARGPGNEVYYGDAGAGWVVIDGVTDDSPAHPGEVAARCFPEIIERLA
jgi:hypothetical protein